MKKNILILLLLFLPLISFCQSLSLEQLIKLHNSDLDDANSFLTEMKWEYEKNDSKGTTHWVFHDNNSKNSWGDYECRIRLVDLNNSRDHLEYRTNITYLEMVKKEVLAKGMKKIETGVDSWGDIYSIYQDSEYVIILRSKEGGRAVIRLLTTSVMNRRKAEDEERKKINNK